MPVSFTEQHAQLAAFLWHRRDAAARAPHHDLATLGDLDERVEAHLDGLRVAGERGFEVASRLVSDDDPGTVFCAAVLALDRGDPKALAGLLDRVAGARALARGLVSAIGWVAFEVASPILSGLLGARSPALRRIGIAASAAHRCDPGPALPRALLQADVPLRARALRAVGELGRTDMLGHVREEWVSTEDACRFGAAWSGALLGEPGAMSALSAFSKGEGASSERAADLACRALPHGEARALIANLEGPSGRAALAGAAALGDPGLVPWVIACMGDPKLARRAGEAFTAITGVAIERGLVGGGPEGGPSDDPRDTDVAMDPDEKLEWPSIAAVSRVWEARAHAFQPGQRYLLGEPVTPARLAAVRCHGKQPRRAGAALEIAMSRRGEPLFEVRARGDRQRAMLGAEA